LSNNDSNQHGSSITKNNQNNKNGINNCNSLKLNDNMSNKAAVAITGTTTSTKTAPQQ
jgi:hypothetical protein